MSADHRRTPPTEAEGINDRKLDHLRAFEQDAKIERGASGFDAIRLTHRALPELDFHKINTKAQFLGKTLSFPLLISSMTGGDAPEILRINRNLAEAAQACGVAMAVGSQRVMFANSAARESFALRAHAPDVPLLANLGAVQLNKGFGLAECREAVSVMDADGLYLHLNPLQEAIQPEGDRDFSGLASKIATICAGLEVPVLLKEVGSGLSPEDVALGRKAGVRFFDVAGRGGTSWSRIEHHRRKEPGENIGLLFQDWGLTTVEALCHLQGHSQQITVIASGGVRNGVDMAKALLLGAGICGIAAPFLAAARQSTEAVIAVIQRLHREFQTALFLLGCADCAALRGNSALMIERP